MTAGVEGVRLLRARGLVAAPRMTLFAGSRPWTGWGLDPGGAAGQVGVGAAGGVGAER
ncbi:hypothetical protein [Salinactinospora qingdaonensis]|uniref:Uncharacterized protein n=1 Tax=Salinactinospora qingdaonensis TaxID=702744 RepID=A0ABP7GHA7_9ACTN